MTNNKGAFIVKNKIFIKLINSERVNLRFASSKACDETSTDICYATDVASCIVNSYDVCTKDFAKCSYNSDDYCTSVDIDPCSYGSTDHSYN